MDFMGLEESKGRFTNVLVITDHYTKYAVAVPTRNQEAKTVAKVLVEQFIVHYGIPERLHSDQGGSFEGKVIYHLCKILGISKSRTTPYHPMGDGITERMNRTLISMLKTLDPVKKQNWKDHVAPLVHAYNCCRHDSTGYTPFYLMFGRCPRLPIDIFLGVPESDGITSSAKSVRQNLEAAYKAASEATKQAQTRQARGYNKKVRGSKIEIGDYVLVKNVGVRGKHKLADKWKQEIHLVTGQPNEDIPVYKVRPETGTGEKVLHRNLLLPLCLPWPQESGPMQGVVTESLHVDSDNEVDSEFSEYEVHIDGLPPISPVGSVIGDDVKSDVVDDVDNGIVDGFDADDNTVPNVSAVGAPFNEQPPPTVELPSQTVISPSLDRPQDLPQASLSGSEGDQEAAGEPGLRRSSRARRPPVRLRDYVSFGQTAHVALDWQLKVAALLQLMPLFPLQHAEIGNAIFYVITHS
jgi:transposase InsO family protein